MKLNYIDIKLLNSVVMHIHTAVLTKYFILIQNPKLNFINMYQLNVQFDSVPYLKAQMIYCETPVTSS